MIAKIRRMLCGKPTRVEPTEHQRLVLDLCTRVQEELSGSSFGPLEVSDVELDLAWRAILTLVRDVPPSPDDDVYRFVLERLGPFARSTLLHAQAGQLTRGFP